MAQSNLATEIRNQTRRFIDGDSSLRAYRVWFNQADEHAHRGDPSNLAVGQAAAMTDEIQEMLSDLDGGFIDASPLMTALHAIVTIRRCEHSETPRQMAMNGAPPR